MNEQRLKEMQTVADNLRAEGQIGPARCIGELIEALRDVQGERITVQQMVTMTTLPFAIEVSEVKVRAQAQRWIPVSEQNLDEEGVYAVICRTPTTNTYLSTSGYHPAHGWEIEAFRGDFVVRYCLLLPSLPED